MDSMSVECVFSRPPPATSLSIAFSSTTPKWVNTYSTHVSAHRRYAEIQWRELKLKGKLESGSSNFSFKG